MLLETGAVCLPVARSNIGATVNRVAFIDIAKGIAIALVVFGHVLGGTLARGWVQPPGTGELVYKFIYTFHMPLFFIISGAFAIDRIRRDPMDAFLSKCGSIAWPYLLWGLLFIIAQPVFSQFMLFPPTDLGTGASLQRLLLGGTSWFLWTLFFCHLLLLLASFVPIMLLFIVSLILAAATFSAELGTFSNIIHFMPFLTFGALVGRKIEYCWINPAAASALVGLLIFGVIFAAVASNLTSGLLVSFAAGVAGSAAALMLAYALRSSYVGAILAVLGEASLVIFLLHPYFQSGARALVLHSFGPALALQLIVPTLAGIAGPAAVWALAERSGLQWLFRLTFSKSNLAIASPGLGK
jgi:fucose 4-O-acetylase-like acetyltransferase